MRGDMHTLSEVCQCVLGCAVSFTGGKGMSLKALPACTSSMYVNLPQPSMLAQGQHWDWFLRKHRELDRELLDALAAIHARGILHGDLHKDNILVTADRRIMILDFAAAQLEAPAAAMEAEMTELSEMLA